MEETDADAVGDVDTLLVVALVGASMVVSLISPSPGSWLFSLLDSGVRLIMSLLAQALALALVLALALALTPSLVFERSTPPL